MLTLKSFFLNIKAVLYHILIWSSAADTTILESDECKRSEHIKHASIGILLFLTASVAAVAGGYMFYLILQDKSLSILLGIFWGIIFFFIDRSVVSTMRKKEKKFLKDFLLGSPRLLLACLASIFVGYGMDLKIFESDINVEMSDNSDSLINRFTSKNNDYLKSNYDSNITDLKSEVQDAKQNLPVELQLLITDYNSAKKSFDSLNLILSSQNSGYSKQIRTIRSKYYYYSKTISQADSRAIASLNTQIRNNNQILKKASDDINGLRQQKDDRLKVHQLFSDSLEIRNAHQIEKIQKNKDTASDFFSLAEKEKFRLRKKILNYHHELHP